jgi:MSHA biogenesis protein MshI
MFRRKQNSGLVAVRVHKDRVDVARVSRDAGPRPSVEVCTSYRREGEVGETLGRIRRELHLERFSCATLLSAGDYQLQVVEAPDVPEPEVKQAVRWRLKDVLDYPVEVATVDVLTVPPNPAAPSRSRSIFAVAARNEMIAARMGEFAQAKVPLAVIDIPEMAQRNLASLFELPGRGLAMLSFDDERGLLTFTQLLVSDADQKRQLFERIVLELQRSLDHFDRQFSSVPIAKVLIAPLPDDVGLETYLIENLYVPVEVAALDSVLDFENTPELANKAMQAQHFLGIGAALRSGSAA